MTALSTKPSQAPKPRRPRRATPRAADSPHLSVTDKFAIRAEGRLTVTLVLLIVVSSWRSVEHHFPRILAEAF